ncbi:MAG: hypothetical protein F6K07_33080, partial [Okeania sp. SIO1H5]|uniref:thiamine-phosphate kinase n=1 Tax=Okeania sp. SIO1H5 TaxID=2607777 RepID=UPI0013B7030A|nr:hypothetical protein [Okeania sp. SIO1H5]
MALSLFPDGPEFASIRSLLTDSNLSRDGTSPGDDCFLSECGDRIQATSVDTSLEGVHYRLDWIEPAGALEKAVLGSLSDLNACGANASSLFLQLGFRSDWDQKEIRNLGKRLRTLSRTLGFQIAGGDMVQAGSRSFFGLTVVGMVAGKPLLRSGAEPGQSLYVSGTLGDSAGGLHCLSSPATTKPQQKQAIAFYHSPRPPFALGPTLS